MPIYQSLMLKTQFEDILFQMELMGLWEGNCFPFHYAVGTLLR